MKDALYTYVGRLGRRPLPRHGEPCRRVLWPGTRKGCISNICVEFEDGVRVVTSRRCVRRVK